MLKPCSECNALISDKATMCPHCGCPVTNITRPRRRNPSKRRKLPNGFGQISELRGQNLRKPFRVLVTTGKTEEGKPICKPLKPDAYFKTYNEAYAALMEYNKNPYNLDENITMKELYERWKDDYLRRKHKTQLDTQYTTAWKYAYPLYDIPVRELRTWHIKHCIETCHRNINGEDRKPSNLVKQNIRFILNMMLDYAIEYDMIDRNYSRAINADSIRTEITVSNFESHIAFTQQELDTLWKNIGLVPYIDVLLVQCYSGWRPQEIGLLKLKNINLKDRIMTGGMKTAAGIGRIVPIHSKIYSLVESRYREAEDLQSNYLFNVRGKPEPSLTYSRYRAFFRNIMESCDLNENHKPHDGRKTFVTLAKKYKVDEYAIKRIIGHSIADLTERTYTDRDPVWLIEEIEKIK